MKNVFSILFVLLISVTTFAQVPQGISYQAIAFTAGGAPVTSANVGVRVSVLSGSATGTAIYTETHTKATNAQGLFNLVIGQGTPVSGTFSTIDWAATSKYLKVEIDPAGGTSYTSTGVNQLMSVPFALSAASVVSSGSNSLVDQLVAARSTNVAFDDYAASKVYAYSTATGAWVSQAYNSNSNLNLGGSKGNFYFDDYADSKFYTFNGKLGTWSSQSYNSSSNITVRLDTLTGNYGIDDYAASIVYVYNVKTATWSSQAYNSNTNVALLSSKGNFSFDDYADNKVYAFSAASNTWSAQTYNSNTNAALKTSNGNFYFDDYAASRVYIFNANTGVWGSQAYNSNSNLNFYFSTSE